MLLQTIFKAVNFHSSTRNRLYRQEKESMTQHTRDTSLLVISAKSSVSLPYGQYLPLYADIHKVMAIQIAGSGNRRIKLIWYCWFTEVGALASRGSCCIINFFPLVLWCHVLKADVKSVESRHTVWILKSEIKVDNLLAAEAAVSRSKAGIKNSHPRKKKYLTKSRDVFLYAKKALWGRCCLIFFYTNIQTRLFHLHPAPDFE